MTQSRSPGASLIAQRIEALRAKRTELPAPAPTMLRMRAIAAATDDTGASGAEAAAIAGPGNMPSYVTYSLARWRLLNDLPFRYLVPDAKLLPGESIRFFTLDSDWLDALAAGALIAVGGGTREIAQVQAALPDSLAASARQKSTVRDVLRGRISLSNLPALTNTQDGSTAAVSGFLLRSSLVSGWPGMQIRAWASDDPADVPPEVDPATLALNRPELVVPILRLERLSPAVLIALFEGVPKMVWLEEPHHGVQYGVETVGNGFRVVVRDESGQDTATTVAVPMRAGPVSGVVNIAGLAAAINGARPLAHPRGSGALALQLLQAPSRQRFNASAGNPP